MMRKVLLYIIFIVLINFLAVIVWAGWQKGFISQGAPKPDFIPPVLTLQVNRQDNVDILQGTPLVFTVYLSGSSSVNPLRIGKPDSPWHTHVQLELAEGKPLPWKLMSLGPPQAIIIQSDASGKITVDGKDGSEAVIDAEHQYTVEFGIGPEESAGISPGRYTVQAVLDVPFAGKSKRVVSIPVVVNVQEFGKTPLTAEQELRRLIESAEFYLQAERFEDAYRLALQVKERQPKKIQSYILLGDALNGLRRDKEALEAYDYALHLSAMRKQYEPPTYLMLRKYEVEQRLRQR